VWFLALVLMGALAYWVATQTSPPAPMPYGAFLNQVDAGNVASATFYGTEIDGRFKHPLESGLAGGTAQRDSYHTRVPDFGDPGLIPELRKEHVAINVRAPSQWASVLTRVPWPLLLVIAVALIAAVVRLVRGPKTHSGPDMPMRPGAGPFGLFSSFLAKSREGEDQPTRKPPGED